MSILSRKAESVDLITRNDKLSEGNHVVHLKGYWETNSFLSFKGEPMKRKEMPAWTDPTEQLGYLCVNHDENFIVGRINLLGFTKFEDLSTEDQESGNFTEDEKTGYALFENEDGDIVRVIDDDKTATGEGILMQLVNALGLPMTKEVQKGNKRVKEQRTIGEILDEAVANDTEFGIKVVKNNYGNLEVSSFMLAEDTVETVKAETTIDEIE